MEDLAACAEPQKTERGSVADPSAAATGSVADREPFNGTVTEPVRAIRLAEKARLISALQQRTTDRCESH